MREQRREKRQRLKNELYQRRYLIPNAVTVGNMFCGFLAIAYSMSGSFEKAAIAIAFAILLDGLDGRVARGLNATSRFGVEFDSLSDVISFGVAPALLIYAWGFQQQLRADDFGIFISFIYVVCAASRLARFNISEPNVKGFLGLPSPGAAAFVAALVNLNPKIIDPPAVLIAICTAVLLGLGFLMVSTIEFWSIKQLKIRRVPPAIRLGMAFAIALLWYHNRIGLFLVASVYCFSGPVLYLRNRFFSKAKSSSIE